MKAEIALITILTENLLPMITFYRDVLGFQPKQEMGSYVEFENPGVRFAICASSVMRETVKHPVFSEARCGQTFELAFPADTPAELDVLYAEIVEKGAKPIQAPANMPWNQRTAFFSDPDGNIHEIFVDLPQSA
ncbi:MAG: VOC family protein [Anaerolineaceae bacterium]|nr:VOC family protein [Anaerolineaceae bacterium]